MRLSLAAASLLLLALPGPVGAQNATPPAGAWPERGYDVSHRWGLGAYSGDAPASVRYFWSPRYGADGGLGFSFGDASGRRGDLVILDGGFLYALAPGERTNLFLRPGVQFRNLSGDGGTATTIRLSASVEAEFFLTGSLSVGARTGIFLDSVSPPAGGDRADLGTSRGMVTEAGFHFYLGSGE